MIAAAENATGKTFAHLFAVRYGTDPRGGNLALVAHRYGVDLAEAEQLVREAAKDVTPEERRRAAEFDAKRFDVAASTKSSEPAETLRARAGVPPATADAITSFAPSAGLTRYRAELDRAHPRWAWLHGPDSATGAAWLCDQHGARFVDCPSLVADLSQRDLSGQDSVWAVARALTTPSVLVVSDVDAIGWTPGTVQAVGLLLRERAQRLLPTMFSSACEPRAFWERTSSRMRTEDLREQVEASHVLFSRQLGKTADERHGHILLAA